MSSLHEALQPLMIAFLSREVYSERLRRSKEIGVVGYPAMKPIKKQKGKRGAPMLLCPRTPHRSALDVVVKTWPEPKAR
jgi:hypothetical protein